MRVRLLETIYDGTGIKVSPPREVAYRKQRQQNGELIEVVQRNPRKAVVWERGAVIDMSEASAKKFIDAKMAEPFVEEKAGQA